MKKSILTLAVLGAFPMMNDAATIDSLQDRLLELKDSANNIQARADAEKRDLTEDETKEIEQIFAAFEGVEADIERRQKIGDINARTATPNGRKTAANDVETEEAAPSAVVVVKNLPNNKVFQNARQADAGKWGFRSAGEYLAAVVKSSARGATPDPRLIANAPTTFGSEGVGADGGFAVPPDFRQQIIIKVLGEDSLLSRTDQMTSSSNTMTVPIDTTTPWQETGGIQATWESEGGQKGQSKPSLEEVSVKLNKLVCLVPLTDELLEDAPAMSGYVNRKAPEKINYKVNKAIISGTGVGQPLGILNSSGTVVVAAESGQAADSLRFENINNMWYRLYSPSRANAIWLMNPDTEAQLPYLKFISQGSGNAVPIYLPPGGASSTPYSTLYGRPIITSEAMPALGDAGDIILGDMSQYLSIVKTGGVRSDVSIHLWFDYDITAFRFVLRVGGQPWWNSAIARPDGQPTRGYFISLGARA
jgi:HK97 family phage major capsid protein